MSKEERGTKRLCEECGNKFYDLNKDPIVCPACEAPFVTEKPKPKPEPKAEAKVKPEEAKAETETKAETGVEETTADDNGPEIVSLEDAAAEEVAGDEDEDAKLADLGDDAEDIPDGEGDEDVFLDDDDDDSDVSDIIVGPVDKDEA